MKICMVGVHGHNNYVFETMAENHEDRIVSVAAGSVGDDAGKLVAKCREIGHEPQLFDDVSDMLDRVGPDIVTVACQFADHASIAAEALKRDIHVFCEKPVATTVDDLRMLEDAWKDSKAQLSAMMGIRYHPHFYTAWRKVNEGTIGRVRLMNAQKSYRLGQRNELYKSRERSGGTIGWVGSHAIDWLLWFSGEEFESVTASHSRKCNHGHGELEASALCHFTMTNDVFCSVSIDYLRPETAPTHGDDRIRIVGSEGVIEVRGGEVFLINNETEGEEIVAALCGRKIFDDFLKQIKGEGECLISAQDAFKVTQACLLARQSADKNKTVIFPNFTGGEKS
jgi:predicted dehydrogenase